MLDIKNCYVKVYLVLKFQELHISGNHQVTECDKDGCVGKEDCVRI